MRLLRYGPKGSEKPGLLDSEGKLRDLSSIICDITPEILGASHLAELALVVEDRLETLPVVSGNPRLGVPVKGIGKYLGVGLNYHDHSRAHDGNLPPEPIIFSKAISCLNGPNDDVMLPRDTQKPDWEAEMGVFIGKTARYVPVGEALDYVAGYTVVNDISDRGFQNISTQWDKGKGCDTFGPVGPWLVTPDEIPDPHNLDLWLELNGKVMQKSNTRHMIFSIAELISNISSYMTLEPGDLIATGTPLGVGNSFTPPVYLKPGDVLRLGVEKLGEQEQHVVPFR
ncbi:2-keto-4-pentenoate hydratase/2-oxohepta-3-ene-1,7-dioic acid hydratase in catechol pathway [Rhizomicrobium palustre]|uniref:2-keto-4-pentenoate hydratase/2-oxohepta-3-ene-1,7-dioic acid hydratase in catechol pathway n=1 Tax=Rhizomicrobium palustre TaxID=189966 RepID=A0A846N0Y1_9PROT|nr:fumarylacetoacetate hydrolase family protein [Rhizomicrobium palustre]NIK89135.1 2-keto-4-pentenoate hydratase/2-oxohepta-3-ene-1,7-dioic acid hydratase in catechol pathway [Rhizomicrobium palustre]